MLTTTKLLFKTQLAIRREQNRPNHSGDAAVASLTPHSSGHRCPPWGPSPCSPWPGLPTLLLPATAATPHIPATAYLPQTREAPPCLPNLQQPVTSDTCSSVCFTISAYPSNPLWFLSSSSVEPFPPRPSSTSTRDLGPCTPLAFTLPARTTRSTRVLWDEPGCLL